MHKISAGLRRTALLLAVLALVMGVGGFALDAADRATASQESIHRTDRLQLADSLSTLANGYFFELEIAQSNLAQTLSSTLGEPAVTAEGLKSGLATVQGAPFAALVDSSGVVADGSTGTAAQQAALVPVEGGLVQMLEAHQMAISSIFDVGDQPTVAIAVPCGPAGVTLVVAYDLDSLPIAAYVQKLQIGPGADPYVVDRAGRLVTSPDPASIGAMAPANVRTAITRGTGDRVVQTSGPAPEVVAVSSVGIGGWDMVIAQPAPLFYGSLWHGDTVFRWTLLSLVMVVAAALLVFHARRQTALQKVADMAVLDSLTGLPNRLAFTQAVEAATHRHRRGESEVALLFCDLDGFKAVNDRLGHAAGDALLVAAADRLRAGVADYAAMKPVVARLGGDEFTVLLQGSDVNAAANALATTLTDSFAEPFVLGPDELNVGVSVGVAFAHPDRDLLRDADVAMYRAKAVRRAGREADTPDRLSPATGEDSRPGAAGGRVRLRAVGDS